MSNAIEVLRPVELFQHLSEEQLALLAEHSREVQFRKNAILMTEGDMGESMYVIQSGMVKVFVSDEDGKELVLYEQGAGAVIGDIALLDDEPRSASVSTLDKTTALMIGKSSFIQCITQSPEMSLGIIRSLTQRLRQATEGSRSLALDNVYRRLADKLQELGVEKPENEKPEPEKPENGKSQNAFQLEKKYSHQDLGNMIGASREMVGKVMAELVKGEYVELQDGIIHVHKKLPRNW